MDGDAPWAMLVSFALDPIPTITWSDEQGYHQSVLESLPDGELRCQALAVGLPEANGTETCCRVNGHPGCHVPANEVIESLELVIIGHGASTTAA
jgi:hypothetical protein